MQNDEVIELLYDKLSAYIDYLKIDVHNGKFKCPRKEHVDSDPSCSIVPHNPVIWHCFGCLTSGNIFTLANIIEGLPLDPPDFWNITVPHLCKIFEIPYEPKELDDNTKEKYQRLRAYKDAASIVCSYPENPEALIYKYLEKRNWNIKTAKLLGIGCVESIDDYLKQMERLGWKKDYLMISELLNKNIFNKNNLIFVVTDDKNKPIGFAARNMNWKKLGKNDTPSPKYINSQNSIIYTKGNILYNLYNAKPFAPPLWIVEGYGDCAKMYECGITNVVAIGSTALTDHNSYSHIELLKRHGINDIILTFDNDDGGQAGLERSLEILNEYKSFNVRICCISGAKDPDEFITKHGIEKFKELTLLKPFNYKLSRFPFDTSGAEISKKMVKYISAEHSIIDQHDMITILAQKTGIPYTIIEKEVGILSGAKDFQKHKEFIEEQEKGIRELRKCKNMMEWCQILELRHKEAQNRIDTSEYTDADLEQYKQRLIKLKNEFSTNKEPGFSCGKFRKIQYHLDGIPKRASYMGLAGLSNIGKTSFLRSLSWEMLHNNSDILIIFMSIDDPLQKIIPAYMSLYTGLEISEISKARKRIWDNEQKKDLFIKGWKKFEELSDRLIVKDISDGMTTIALEKYIKYYMKTYPDKKLFVMVDNFHKLADFSEMNDKSKFTAISSRIKEISIKYDIPILCVFELRKLADYSRTPTLQDVKETVSIEYDCDLIWLMHQEMHIQPSTNRAWYMKDENGNSVKMPVVDLFFAKNKESDFKGCIPLKFKPNVSRFDETTPEEDDILEGGGNKKSKSIKVPMDNIAIEVEKTKETMQKNFDFMNNSNEIKPRKDTSAW